VCAVLCKAAEQTARAQQICQQAAFKGKYVVVCVCVCAVLCKAAEQTARAQQICQQAAFKGNTWLCV